MVVVPTLLTTPAELEEQVERLEVHYLASQDGDLRFALLSDWTDSATEAAPNDDELFAAAAAAIARLNQRYGPRRRMERDFSCSIAGGPGTRPKESGWDGSANAASSTS